MNLICRVAGHDYADWVEWLMPELRGPTVEMDGGLFLQLGPAHAIPNYRGQRCARCGATFPGATCKPARESAA